jgi:hypothetical protein
MKDELKDFVNRQRAAFDDKEIPEQVWENVEQTLFTKTTGLNPIRYWQAAAVLFFALSSFLLLQKGFPFSKPGEAKEFAETEAFYSQQISDKTKLIHSVEASDLNGFAQDIQQLEAMYAVLKEEMDRRPSEKVRDALILNMMVRINLLNKQLQEVDQQQKEDKAAVIS